MSRIKICGLKRIEDIRAVNEYKPDYIGFVFADTKRFITDETAAYLKSELDPAIRAVGVFVNEPIEHIVKLIKEKTIDMIQLHGQENESYVNQLRKELTKAIGPQHIGEESRIPIIQAVRIDADQKTEIKTDGKSEAGTGPVCRGNEKKQEFLERNQRLIENTKRSEPDFLLFDSKVRGILGGSGQSFDIEGLPDNQTIGLPYFLAGGISLQNVGDLIKLKRPFGIDVSSAVETDGWKDKNKIKAIIEAVRKENV